jgi:hypothetical protein
MRTPQVPMLLRTTAALSVSVGMVVASSQATQADEPAAKTFELTLSPAAEPVPALKYHLLPPLEELVRGNAAPIYLRVIFEHSSGDWHKRLRDEPERLLKMPLDDMPLEEAKKTLSTFEDVIEQTSAAGFRSDCDWQYVLEEDPLQTRLPDAQSMRSYARLLLLKSRYEIRTGNPRAAIARLRDGFALARHVSRAPFLVNQLIGNAIAEVMITELDEVIRLDGAPNLYWALNELPQPIVTFDEGLATESKIIQLRFPELAVPKASVAWPQLSERMRDWAINVAKSEGGVEAVLLAAQIQKKVTPEQLNRARAELPEIAGYSSQDVAGMSDAEVEVRYTLALHRLIYDAWRKWFRVPYDQASSRTSTTTDELRTEARRRELYPLVSLLTPLRANLTNLLGSQARSTRQVARLQVIEALRMHAAATGKLPETLDEVSVVPVPLDPATGGPFAYTLDGETATLDVTAPAGMQRETLRMPVRITLRK